jgi:hypothetical protein
MVLINVNERIEKTKNNEEKRRKAKKNEKESY